MRIEKQFLFPAVLMLLNIGSALMCFLGGDWRRGCYWMASGVCILMVNAGK